MSMITCPDCNNNISDAASACPNCGNPNANKPMKAKPVGILLGICIFFLPLLFSWFTLRKGHTKKARAISFTWMVLVFALLGSQDVSKSSSASQMSTIMQDSVERAMQVNIRDILSAYENNEVGADNKYKGKRIQVTGIIDDIKKDILDNLYVTIGTGRQFEIPQIQAFFDDSMNTQLGQLKKGSQLTIIGKVDGLMMNVLIKDCVISPTET